MGSSAECVESVIPRSTGPRERRQRLLLPFSFLEGVSRGCGPVVGLAVAEHLSGAPWGRVFGAETAHKSGPVALDHGPGRNRGLPWTATTLDLDCAGPAHAARAPEPLSTKSGSNNLPLPDSRRGPVGCVHTHRPTPVGLFAFPCRRPHGAAPGSVRFLDRLFKELRGAGIGLALPPRPDTIALLRSAATPVPSADLFLGTSLEGGGGWVPLATRCYCFRSTAVPFARLAGTLRGDLGPIAGARQSRIGGEAAPLLSDVMVQPVGGAIH